MIEPAHAPSLYTQGEVLCTQGLAYLLRDPDSSARLVDEIQTRTSVTLPPALRWQAEAHQQDAGRPDLEATVADGTPYVKVEAKLGADLDAGQLRSYLTDLHVRAPVGVLIVLVPKHRIDEAESLVVSASGAIWQV